MSKKIIGVVLISIIIIFGIYYLVNSEEKENNVVFHVNSSKS